MLDPSHCGLLGGLEDAWGWPETQPEQRRARQVFLGFFPGLGTGMPAKLGEGTRLGKASGDCGHRRWQRDAGSREMLLGTFLWVCIC